MKTLKKRIFEIVSIGNRSDIPSTLFDFFIVAVIAVNLFVTLFLTYEQSAPYEEILSTVELVTILIFIVEYVLRVWTSEYLFPGCSRSEAVFRFAVSFYGIIDLLTILPYFLPLIFPAGAVAFRMFRVVRIFRLFRINAQNDAFNVIINVLKEKKNQIISSVSMVLIFMMAASLCMYSLEHDAQPDNFKNAFSGIWWSVSTLLTVGYGDIYPVTTMGRVMAIVISFLGVGLVAIPTGIISAGFVEQYTKLKNSSFGEEHGLHFMTVRLPGTHSWCKKQVKEIDFPPQTVLILLLRNGEAIVPDTQTTLFAGDILVLTEKCRREMDLKEIVVGEKNPWVGEKIKNLDISRRELIVLLRRNSKSFVPDGETRIKSGDTLVVYTKRG